MQEQREGIHVTELVELEICERKFWFRKHEPVPPDLKSLLRMWKGKKLHETPITDQSEVTLERHGVIGRIDEIAETPERITLIDKKFVSFLPRNDRDVKKYYSHYITQLDLYSGMLNGLTLDREVLAVLFFVNPEEEPFFYVYAWKPDLNSAEQKLLELKDRAYRVISLGEPPARNPSFQPADYPCSYCDYTRRCWLNGWS